MIHSHNSTQSNKAKSWNRLYVLAWIIYGTPVLLPVGIPQICENIFKMSFIVTVSVFIAVISALGRMLTSV